MEGTVDALDTIPISGSITLLCSKPNCLRIFTLEPLRETARIELGVDSQCVVSPDGRRFVVRDGDQLNMFDLETRDLLWTQVMLHGCIMQKFSTTGRLLASVSGNRMIRISHADSGEVVSELEGHRGLVNSVVFSHDERTAISSEGNGELRFWHISNGEPLCEMTPRRSDDHIRGIEFDPTGDRLLIIYNDGTAQLLPLQPAEPSTTGTERGQSTNGP